ncbi:hypothetical protein JL101_036570 (plasmid) [Skermanella rosea]|uniref:hypothetical protein n=1 Tax=Skermanella rosea TaxID=1817965 RepID=UPI0019325571|nr:hypothetical protein [Skermanella rosea]UEM08215.1 hypothetical protein JL101_036570 [Skermanella rosea]
MITVKVNSGAFHPPHIRGAPVPVFWTNLGVNMLLAYAVGLSFWLVLPLALFAAVHAVFASVRAKGPFYLRFLLRSTFGPIRHLDP